MLISSRAPGEADTSNVKSYVPGRQFFHTAYSRPRTGLGLRQFEKPDMIG
jgi:hypothetical protein